MSNEPDLSLPLTAPSMARYREHTLNLPPTALYTLVDLTDTELEECQRECESKCVECERDRGTSVRLAPQSRFVGQPLRAAFDYHIDLAAQNIFEPFYFIAVVKKDWRSKGVILVTLNKMDAEDSNCNVDSFRTKAADSGLNIANLQIANMGWDELKDFTGLHSDEGDDEDDKTDKNKNDDDVNKDDGPPAPIKDIPLGYYIPIYIHSGLLEEDVVAKLEPGFKHKSLEDLACRVQAKLTPPFSTSSPTSTRDLIQQAAILHPQRCSKNRWLQKTHILVIDTANPDENGMLMAKLPSWDGSHSETTGNRNLRGIGKGTFTTPPHIRIPYSCNDGLQTRFLILANGDADWPSESVREQPVFIVFQYNTHGKELGFCADSIDSEAAKRSPGEERLVYAPQVIKRPSHGLEQIKWSYDEAVKRFPWFCREKRFIEGLDKEFFICVDGDDMTKTGLLLVRRKWDGNLWDRTRDELLDLPVDDVKTVRVPVEEALAILEKGRKGETNGMSDSLKDFFL
ncbi:uncharacterized protein EAF02_002508 [Botrytis sinoallii]|uniref:uncharacterized protein n=1 Tax=Botrytis sinoallii TaxID=1463999 RepID=UPI001901FF5A|nr:uncharacterized protein EAF02_002508 [Botrytis sinoallii]KAF7890093.1 hypothetical protein EAF02_002508 [Botrytis sinoallii]